MIRHFFLAILAITFFCVPDPELDLPILPPNDPRREGYKKDPTPPPPKPPEGDNPEVPPVFFGEEILPTSSLVYVLDFSQSMSIPAKRIDYKTVMNRWELVLEETHSSISNLSETIKFDIVVFGTNQGCSVATWSQTLKAATTDNKTRALEWLNQFQNVTYYGGATPTAQGVLEALSLHPEGIILLTDGQPSPCGIMGAPMREHRKVIKNANMDGVRIDVFGIGLNPNPRTFCIGIASDNGGSFFEIVTGRV